MFNSVVLLGELAAERQSLDSLAWKFGWSLKNAATLNRLKDLSADLNVVAVLFQPRALDPSWEHALQAVREAAPAAFPIVCHGFSDPLPWPDVAAAGAFHGVHLPFDLNELRQSFGFVWAAWAGARNQKLPSAQSRAPRADTRHSAMELRSGIPLHS